LTSRPRRNHVLTQITPTYARAARRRASECPAFHRTIDRKVSILLRLRKESASLPSAPPGQDNGTEMENVEEASRNDISSRIFGSAASGARGHGQDARVTAGETPAPQGVFQSAGMEGSKMNDRCGNIYENKGPVWKTGMEAGISLKTNGLSPSRQECY